jgi:hypothetical protein
MNNVRSPTPNIGLINSVTNTLNNMKNSAINAVNNVAASATNVATNVASNAGNTNIFANIIPSNNGSKMNMVNSSEGGFFSTFAIIVIVLLLLIAGLIYYFYNEIVDYINSLFPSDDIPNPANLPGVPTPLPPMPDGSDSATAAVERVLPASKEVFNVSENKYTYYDAQALCKSLDSELATYDQVKDAFDKGADWCNYGWTEGQMALYPTQKASWEKLQAGPESKRTSCGEPGINGGRFDNPELQFGVNCYGPKPSESKHDARSKQFASEALSPEELALEKRIATFRGKQIPIMPFSGNRWSQ